MIYREGLVSECRWSMKGENHQGLPFVSSLLFFRGSASFFGSLFQAHNPSMFDQELSGDAEAIASSCLA